MRKILIAFSLALNVLVLTSMAILWLTGGLWIAAPDNTDTPAVSGLFTPVAERLVQHGRWFTDRDRRIVMLRGGNLALPDSRWAPGKGVDNGTTPRLLAEQGFNGVRLLAFFSELMPEPGVIDPAYLERLRDAVAGYREAGVHVLLDFHQDEFGAKVGLRGFPDWATFSGGHVAQELPFPAGYFSDPAVQVAFDNFWGNNPVPGTDKGVQDLYIEGLVEVARVFRDEPAMLGIDVMNEPFPGSRCNQPDPSKADCPELEEELLGPFYDRMGMAIAAVAPELIVFVEPFMLQGALGLPINTPTPGRAPGRGLSYHNYGTLADIRRRVDRYALAAAERMDAAIINTEWGFTNDPEIWTAQAEEFDEHLISWLAWARGPFTPLIDPSLPASGNDNREATLRALARPYPKATAGTPEVLSFDQAGGVLEFGYRTLGPDGSRQDRGVTEIVMPPANFPNGYTVSVDGQAEVISSADATLLKVRAEPGADRVVIRARRKGELAPLADIVATENPYEFLAQPPRDKHDGRLSVDAMLGDLLADTRARGILEREVPDLVNSPQIGMGSQMSLRAIAGFVPEILDDATLERIDQALGDVSRD